MNPDAFRTPDPEMRAYLAAEETAIEQLLAVAASGRKIDAERSMYITMEAKRRARELLAVREWLDLQ